MGDMEEKKSAFTSLPTYLSYLLVLTVVVFISFLFPNNVKFKYQFEKGQVWRYDDLVAPFDFAIRKTDDEIQTEKKAIEADFSPYYEVIPAVAKNSKQSFDKQFNLQLELVKKADQFKDVTNHPERYHNYGTAMLDRMFNRGIIALDSAHQNKGKDFVINIVEGNTSYQQTLDNILSLKTAQSLLSDSLPYSRLSEPEFLYPIMENVLAPNLLYSDTLSQMFQKDALGKISTARGKVKKGELIIPNNGYVTDDIYQKLVSYRFQYEKEISDKKSYLYVFLGYFLLTSLIIGVFILYLKLFYNPIVNHFREMLFMLLWLFVYSYLVYAVEQTAVLSTYLIPFCIVPIVVRTFYDGRLALFTHIVIVLIASFLSSLGYEFTIMQILAGIVVVLSDVNTRDWSRFFYSMLFIFLTYALAYFGLSLIQEGALNKIDWSVYNWIAMNAFLTLLAYPLVPLLERLFGYLSPITLVELSDMNRPLLRELALKAPGTLQHSLQVANLAEAAASKIGADPLLVKVAALYHDIGKTANPLYFIENQSGKNPHDDISNLESAEIIIGHVTEGVEMAKKYKLPKVLVDFIKTHHGNTRVEYFYKNYIVENPGKDFDEALFRYPGPRPSSKEETILMIADTIEAACKSLKSPSEKELVEFIDKLVAGKITHGQLENSNMTFSEFETCVEVFKQIMKSVYHVRIEYPEEESPTPTEDI
ncbi:MAG: HDIG domain-containing protein [Saprospiraceae bacterium]|nr:MAG: HDIG domain-containing protein [Saprospiraceae bacterium]